MTQNTPKIQGKFYPLTPNVAKKLRKAKLTAAEWRFWAYLVELDPYGDRYHDLNTLSIISELEISKATYYRAIAKFQKLGLFDFQDKGFSFKNETGVSKMRNESQKCETSLKNETEFSKMRQPVSKMRKSEAEKPTQQEFQSSSEYKTYKDFIQTLSQGERESFIKFSRKKAASLPKPPQLPMKWIKANFEELLSQWRETKNEKENQKTKYNFEAMSEAQHQMFHGQLQVVVKSAVEFDNDTSLRLFFNDEFHGCWFNWAKSHRADVSELLANNPILETYSHD